LSRRLPPFRRDKKNRQYAILEPIFTHMMEYDVAMSNGDIINAMSDLGYSSHMMPTRSEIGLMAVRFAKSHDCEIRRTVYEMSDNSPANVYGTRKLRCFRLCPLPEGKQYDALGPKVINEEMKMKKEIGEEE